MRINSILLVLFGIIVSSIIIYSIHHNKYSRLKENSFVEKGKLVSEINYLKNCLKYQNSLSSSHFPDSVQNGVIVYYPKNVCVSCLEKLLHLFKSDLNIKTKVYVLVDDSTGIKIIESFNDAFQYRFDAFLVNSISTISLYEILISQVGNKESNVVLKFMPGEERIFKKYFSEYVN